MSLRKNDPAVIKFGDQYLKMACVLECCAGGSGPYGNRKIFFDSWAEDPTELPGIYSSVEAHTIRGYAEKLGTATDASKELKFMGMLNTARREFVKKYDIFDLIERLEDTACEIKDPIRKQTRVDQVNGLYALAHVLLYDIGLSSYCPPFPKIVESMTGISPAMIPTIEELNKQRDEVSALLIKRGYSGSSEQYIGPCIPEKFKNQVAAWKSDLGRLSKEQFLEIYKKNVEKLVRAMKRKIPGFPAEARVKIITPEEVGFDRYRSGSFDYGRGGRYMAETRVTPDKGMTLLDLARVNAHEIGMHFRQAVLYHKHYIKTRDKLGATGTMCSNLSITDEGLAELGTKIYETELVDIFGKKIMQDNVIADKLEELATAAMPFETNRARNLNDITREGMIQELIDYGVDKQRAVRRTEGIFNPLMTIKILAYYGVTYWQGGKFIRGLIKKYGLESVLDKCKEPISLVALSKALEN